MAPQRFNDPTTPDKPKPSEPEFPPRHHFGPGGDLLHFEVGHDQLQDREERFRLLVEGVREYAIFGLDPVGHITTWNVGAQRLKGYRADEAIGKHFSIFYLPEDVRQGKPEQRLIEAASNGQSIDEGWRLRKDGTRFFAYAVITAVRDPEGELRGFVRLTRDLTEQREKEQALRKAKEELELRVERRTAELSQANVELRTEVAVRQRVQEQFRHSLDQLRELAARVHSSREEERKRIAREIHDEFGQACTALRIDLSLLSRRISARQKKLRDKAQSAIRIVDDLIQSMRRMASDLRPSTLDDLGLPAAIEWQAQQFEERTGIQCLVTIPNEQVELDSERATTLFRIFQETLTNVARHAEATNVHTQLQRESDFLVLRIQDNGKGFDPRQTHGNKTLGLLGMKERAILVGGDLRVDGRIGLGVTVTVRVPVSSPVKETLRETR